MGATVGILPAAGLAVRFGGIPKFLLPVVPPHTTLLEHHAILLRPLVERLIVPTRPSWSGVVEQVLDAYDVEVLEVESATMSETVMLSLDRPGWDLAMVGMPDTFFVNTTQNPYQNILSSPKVKRAETGDPVAVVGVYPTLQHQRGQVGSVDLSSDRRVLMHADKDKEKDYGHHWGQLLFNAQCLRLLDPASPHVGYLLDPLLSGQNEVWAVDQSGVYIDCGTFDQYRRVLCDTQG